MIQVSFPFDAVTHAQLRKIRPPGTWHGFVKGWEFPFSAAECLNEQFASRFFLQDEFSQWLTLLRDPLPPLPPYPDLLRHAEFEKPLLDGRRPLQHQCSGARWLMSRSGALLADEMGLGKTVTTLLAARAIVRASDVRLMVIAPVGLHTHWQQEAKAVGVQIDLQSWASIPKELFNNGTLLIVDEAHFAQRLKAKRTKALLRLARHPRLTCIWLVTGTPMKNGRPSELYPLLAAIDHPLASNQRDFEKKFCCGHWKQMNGRRTWDSTGASNLIELRRLVQPVILNRFKKSILELPPKLRQEYPVVLPPEERKGFEHRLTLIVDDYRFRIEQGLVNSDAESLVVLSALRQISAEFKLPAVSKLLGQFRSLKRPVVLFSSFLKPLHFLHQELGGELLTGKQSMEERELAINRFQSGKESLLLATYGAAGLGYTLHRARDVVLLERPWTPGEVDQAEDRCHRLGMDGPLTSHWFKLGFIDELVDGLVANKAERIEVLMGTRRVSLTRQTLPAMFKTYLAKIKEQ